MVTVIWTEVALADLRSIHASIAKDSKVYASRLVDRIVTRVGQLQQFPRSGRVVPEFGQEDIRELIEGSYRVIYRVQDDKVGITRVHHSSRMLHSFGQ